MSGLLVWWVVHLSVIVVLAAEAVPGINESHYLTKAKHAWDSSFAAGDLFLQSHNAHFLASALAGVLAKWLSLTQVAWIGRLLSWAFLALAWCRFASNLRFPLLVSVFVLAGWHLWIEYGNWAGEWAIGGFEAKSLAYPCVLLGLANLVRRRWSLVWLWLALAVAWHPLVGGWAGLTVGCIWLVLPDLQHRAGQQWPWLLLAIAIGLIGVLPAATGINEPARDGKIVASQIHVYYRLAHHQCPLMFADSRHLAAVVSLVGLGAISFAWFRRMLKRQSIDGFWRQLLLADARDWGTTILLIVAWLSVGISLAGLLIDVTLSRVYPATASGLLRFYWFRWSDVAVPLAGCLTLGQLLNCSAGSDGTVAGKTNPWRSWDQPVHWLRLGLAALILVASTQVYIRHWQQRVPTADQLLMEAPANHEIETNRYVDWLAACRWIRENTPSDSLWLTPKYQQTFKWYAGRAEVVCWKDVPQNNQAVIEWYRRVEACQPPRDASGKLRGWKTDEVLQLAKQYGFEWILVDRRIQHEPLLLEIAYPINIDNKSFAVFHIPKWRIED